MVMNKELNTVGKETTGNLYAVYGTLRQGFGNWNWILNNEDCEYLGTQRTEADFRMVSLGGFPGVIPGGNQSVVIEVFRVNNPAIDVRLDRLEGYPRFYDKMKVETEWGTADMYILGEDYASHTPVPNGDWKEFVNSKKNLY
jgi:gamma-glutamylcyclotransferase (GGCT)/AIG2-like uncharacterized protein YtfP